MFFLLAEHRDAAQHTLTISLNSCVFAVLKEATCIPFYFLYFYETDLSAYLRFQHVRRDVFVLGSTDATTSIVHHVVVAGRTHLQGETLVSILVG